jgi:ABC-type multidrug transport system ATPase subunit
VVQVNLNAVLSIREMNYNKTKTIKGKTTLLNVLTMRNQNKLISSGMVKINGYQISNVSQLAAISGYVQQDDLFIGTLKVEEHLKFQV